MGPPRSVAERYASSSSYRSSRDYRDQQLPRRYQLPQQSFPSQRNGIAPPVRRRSPPPPRRDYPPRRDEPRQVVRRDGRLPPRRQPPPRRSGPGPSRSAAPIRRLADVNPFQRRGARERLPSRRLPERDVPASYSSARRPSRADRRSKWLPPVRNPARYIDPPAETAPLRERSPDDQRYPEREITPIPPSRRRGDSKYGSHSPIHRSRSPIARTSRDRVERSTSRLEIEQRPYREGPRTPPEPDQGSDHSNDAYDEETEIFEMVRDMFKQCYQDDKISQAERFSWLKNRMHDILQEIDSLRNQPSIDDVGELEEIDSTDNQPNNFQNLEHDLNGEELDYQEEPDSSSCRALKDEPVDDDNEIMSPPPEEHAFDNEGIYISKLVDNTLYVTNTRLPSRRITNNLVRFRHFDGG